ncbi:unnamed protein product [Eruca vesicaria subsp. sativa]|uniref:Uncharacterized protein n=1 Tax=Eruca vesicaria subsp. sativa TaxID=29727 RepID=A0ABC8JBH2_ERUVS|nr:unnamed protein product [Eruca vesicaria subsp. sativa]
MVFSGEVEDYTATKTRRERRKTRHNFTLPDLKWGVQRSLRCISLQSHGGVDNRRSSENGGEEGIEEYGEKIISDVRTEAEKKMKKSILWEVSPPGVAAEVKPWNLRKRRAACKAPPEPENCNEVKFVSTLLKKEMEDDYMILIKKKRR